MREEFQVLFNGTIGRAIESFLPNLGEEDEVIKKLKSVMSGKLPSSPNDFTYGRSIFNGIL